MNLLLLPEKACLGGDPAQMRCARRQQAPAFLFSAHLSPRAKPSMGGSVFALVQSPGTAAEAAAFSLKPGVSREEGLLLLLSPVALALEAFPGEEAAEHPPPLPLQGIFWGQEGWDPPCPRPRGQVLCVQDRTSLHHPQQILPFQKYCSAVLHHQQPLSLLKAWRRCCPRVQQN